MPRWLSSMFGGDYYSDEYRDRRRRVIYTNDGYRGSRYGSRNVTLPARVPVTTHRQTCGSCGKYRSPSWSARNPLRTGEIPISSICRKCAGKSTSSERLPHHTRRRGHHRHHRDYTGYSYGTYSSLEARSPRRRYHSDSLGYIRPRSLARSPSTERVNIIIQDEAHDASARVRTVTSSENIIYVTRHPSVDRLPRRRIVRSVSSSPVITEEIEEHYLPRRRPLSRTRARSRSSVHFEDELDEPHFQRRPRSLSRDSYVEEIVVPRRRSYTRRRSVFVDGPAETPTEAAGPSQISARDWASEDVNLSRARSYERLRSVALGNDSRNSQTYHRRERQTSAKRKLQTSAGIEGKDVSTVPVEKVTKPELRHSSSSATAETHPTTKNEKSCHSPTPFRPTVCTFDLRHSEEHSQPPTSGFYGPSDFSSVASESRNPVDLSNWARKAFSNDDWEEVSQYPSPSQATFAVPRLTESPTLSPLRTQATPTTRRQPYPERGQRYTYPIIPADGYSGLGSSTAYPGVYTSNSHFDGPPSPAASYDGVSPPSADHHANTSGRREHYTDPASPAGRRDRSRDTAPYSSDYERNRGHHASPGTADRIDGVPITPPSGPSYERIRVHTDLPIATACYDRSPSSTSSPFAYGHNGYRHSGTIPAHCNENTHIPPPVATPPPATATTASFDPAHPDHLAYLLSTAQTTPSHEYPGVYEYTNNHGAWGPIYDTPPATPSYDRDPSFSEYANGSNAFGPSISQGTVSNSVGSVSEEEKADEEFGYEDRRARAAV